MDSKGRSLEAVRAEDLRGRLAGRKVQRQKQALRGRLVSLPFCRHEVRFLDLMRWCTIRPRKPTCLYSSDFTLFNSFHSALV